MFQYRIAIRPAHNKPEAVAYGPWLGLESVLKDATTFLESGIQITIEVVEASD